MRTYGVEADGTTGKPIPQTLLDFGVEYDKTLESLPLNIEESQSADAVLLVPSYLTKAAFNSSGAEFF